MHPRHFFVAVMLGSTSAIAVFLCWTASQAQQKKEHQAADLLREKRLLKQLEKKVKKEKERIALDFFAHAIPRKQFALHFFSNFNVLDTQFNELRVLMNTYPKPEKHQLTSVHDVQLAYHELEEHHNITKKIAEDLLCAIQESTFEVILIS